MKVDLVLHCMSNRQRNAEVLDSDMPHDSASLASSGTFSCTPWFCLNLEAKNGMAASPSPGIRSEIFLASVDFAAHLL